VFVNLYFLKTTQIILLQINMFNYMYVKNLFPLNIVKKRCEKNYHYFIFSISFILFLIENIQNFLFLPDVASVGFVGFFSESCDETSEIKDDGRACYLFFNAT